MSHNTAATVAHTIGIDTGKNTLHLIGLDEYSKFVNPVILPAGCAKFVVQRIRPPNIIRLTIRKQMDAQQKVARVGRQAQGEAAS